jgi:hypothetical protein
LQTYICTYEDVPDSSCYRWVGISWQYHGKLAIVWVYQWLDKTDKQYDIICFSSLVSLVIMKWMLYIYICTQNQPNYKLILICQKIEKWHPIMVTFIGDKSRTWWLSKGFWGYHVIRQRLFLLGMRWDMSWPAKHVPCFVQYPGPAGRCPANNIERSHLQNKTI